MEILNGSDGFYKNLGALLTSTLKSTTTYTRVFQGVPISIYEDGTIEVAPITKALNSRNKTNRREPVSDFTHYSRSRRAKEIEETLMRTSPGFQPIVRRPSPLGGMHRICVCPEILIDYLSYCDVEFQLKFIAWIVTLISQRSVSLDTPTSLQDVRARLDRDMEDLRTQLDRKNSEIASISSDLESAKQARTRAEDDLVALQRAHKRLKLTRDFPKFPVGPAFYVATKSLTDTSETKIGVTTNMNTRLATYRTSHRAFMVHAVLYLKDNKELEKAVIDHFRVREGSIDGEWIRHDPDTVMEKVNAVCVLNDIKVDARHASGSDLIWSYEKAIIQLYPTPAPASPPPTMISPMYPTPPPVPTSQPLTIPTMIPSPRVIAPMWWGPANPVRFMAPAPTPVAVSKARAVQMALDSDMLARFVWVSPKSIREFVHCWYVETLPGSPSFAQMEASKIRKGAWRNCSNARRREFQKMDGLRREFERRLALVKSDDCIETRRGLVVTDMETEMHRESGTYEGFRDSFENANRTKTIPLIQ